MDWIVNSDIQILQFIQEHLRFESLDHFWKAITFLGNAGWFWIVLSVVLLCIKKTRPAAMVALVSLTVCFIITNLVLKNAVARIRPYDAYHTIIRLIEVQSDYSFPSGHTCASFACALIYFRMLPKRWGIPMLVLATLIAFSRLYLGVHYPSDVIGGFLIALAGSTLVYHIADKKYHLRQFKWWKEETTNETNNKK